MKWGCYLLGVFIMGAGLTSLLHDISLSAAIVGTATIVSAAAMIICAAFIESME